MKIKIATQTPKVKPKIKCNMFCRNVFYIHVVKMPKVAPHSVLSLHYLKWGTLGC